MLWLRIPGTPYWIIDKSRAAFRRGFFYFVRDNIGGLVKQVVLNQSNKKAISASSEDIAQELKSKMDNLKLNFYDMEKGRANYKSMKH